jgi:hypothetical protein
MHCPQLHYELFIYGDHQLTLGRSPSAGNAPSPSPPFLGARFSVFISFFITLGITATCATQRGGQPHVQLTGGVPHRRSLSEQNNLCGTGTLPNHMSVRARLWTDDPYSKHVRTRAARRLLLARSPRAHGWFSQLKFTRTQARSVLVCNAINVRAYALHVACCRPVRPGR